MSNQTNYAYAPHQVYEIGDTPSLRAVFMRYLHHWPWFLLSLALAGAAAYVYLLYQTPIYRVQTSLLIKDDKKGLSEESILKEIDIFAPKKVIENEMEILKSSALMRKVVSNLWLNVRYYHDGQFGKQEVYGELPVRVLVEQANPLLYETDLDLTVVDGKSVRINGTTYPVNQSIQTPYGRLRLLATKSLKPAAEQLLVRVMPERKAAALFLKNLTVETSSKASTVLLLTLEDAVPRRAETLLTRLISEYNQAAIVDKNRAAINTQNFIEERLRLLSGELSTVEKGVESFKSAEGITDLSSQAQVFLETVKDNDAQLNQTTIQLGAVQDIERYMTQKANERGAAPTMLGISDPVLVSLVSRVSDLEMQRDQLSRTTAPSNPVLQATDSQLKATRASLTENIQNVKQTLLGTQRQLKTTNRRLEGQIRTIPRKERALMTITRQQSIKNNLYTYLLEKREETALSYASTVADSRTIDPPGTDDNPIKPVGSTIYLLFGLVGLLLPVGVMAGRDALNDRVSRRSDVEDASQVPILAEVAASRDENAMLMLTDKRSIIGEQIRILRTNLNFLRSSPTNSQVILFTSSISGEGKSFLSMNLGASLSMVSQQTVILEMDLRKPRLHAVMDLPNRVGLSNYLIQAATLDDILQPVPGFPGYSIITSGPLPPNPSELLSSPRLEQLFVELRQRFNYVIVDSPPVGLVTDAQLIAPFADVTLFIVRCDHTPKNCLRNVDLLFKEHRFQRLNVVMNGMGMGASNYYKYGYYEKETRKTRRLLS